jgi:hypothetical protein
VSYYVDVNVGPSAISARRVPGLLCDDDPHLGELIAAQARYQPVSKLLQSIRDRLTTASLGWRIVQRGAGLVFTIYQHRDLADSIVFVAAVDVSGGYTPPRYVDEFTDLFSDRFGRLVAGPIESNAIVRAAAHSIAGFDISETAGANYLIGGGAGSLQSRLIVERGDSDAIVNYGRIEAFVNHSDVEDPTTLASELQGDLAGQAVQWAVELELAGNSFRFGEDFDLGDVVTVELFGERFVEAVREVEVQLAGDVAKVIPRIGTPGAQLRPGESRLPGLVAAVNDRVDDIERNA